MNGDDLIKKLSTKLGAKNLKHLSELTGIKYPTLNSWKGRVLTELQVANALETVCLVSSKNSEVLGRKIAQQALEAAIEPLIEYAPITSSGGKTPNIQAQPGFGHLVIWSKVEGQTGIYIFYSSLGRPIYLGKAKDTELWTESNSAFKRTYKGALYLVNHPHEGKKAPKNLKLGKQDRKVYDVAAYYSAYKVDRELVNSTEALLIRAFINELANVKVENIDALKA